MKNRLSLLILTALACLVGCAATEQSGPDESAKTRLSSNAGAWADAFNKRDFAALPQYYAPELDFNGRPLKQADALHRMEDFLTQDYNFEARFAPGSWKLDSMRGKVYAGHLTGHAKYDGVPDSIPLEVALWMSMLDGSNPVIVGQFDKIGAAYETLKERKKHIDLSGRPFDEEGNPSYYFWQAMLDSAALMSPGLITYMGKYQDLYYTYPTTAAEKGKLGIADMSGKLLLPMSFDDIGTIGVFAPQTVEVRQGTLKGLYKLDGSVALPVEYDALLPGFNKDGVAIWAQKGSRWQAFSSDFRAVQPEGGMSSQNPDWAEWLTALPFDSDWDCRSEFYKPAFLSSVYCDGEGKNMSCYMGSYHILRLPFAMTERHMFEDLSGGGFEYDGGTLYSVDSIFQQPDGKTGMLTTIESWGIGGRESYHNEELRWVVFEDELQDTAQSVTLFYRNIAEDAKCSTGSYKILGDSLVQVLDRGYLLDYAAMPHYRYYRFDAQRRLELLYPDRDFSFMSVVRIDANFLKGCFYGSATDEERTAFGKTQKEPLEEYQEVDRVTQHFTASDLDYLVNEVYAAHGLRFKTPKWQEHFGKKEWYKPTADDVESQLSSTERANIALVRGVQTKLRQREEDYTRPTFSLGESYY
jgi:hypothetical protein